MSERDTHYIDMEHLSIKKLKKVVQNNYPIALSTQAQDNIADCRRYLDKKMAENGAPIYGINTGFGSLCNTIISPENLEELQRNLVCSHACGIGEEVPEKIVKLMLFLKIQSLSYGHSGVSVETVQRLVDFYNYAILPVVYEQGSLGASGDLAPLAHLSLPIMGLGEVRYDGKKLPAGDVLARFGWKAQHLQSKEGLALLNGTQFMSAYGVYCLIEAQKILKLADLIAALSIEAFDGRIEPFDPLTHIIRKHKGQIETAQNITNLLKNSQIIAQPKKHVQDPYSFRCIPQVHGASKDAIRYVKDVFTQEINSVTDNPNIFPMEDKILSGGNFHGQPLAIALDMLCIAVAEIANISERRTYQLISGLRDLPAFLIKNSGLNSGMMIPQYTAASIVSQNKQLCTPASVDSIVSSNGQEDHVSMGANAATKAYRVVENAKKVLAIELLTASQAFEFRRPLRSSEAIEKLISEYREVVTFVENDRLLHDDIKKSIDFINSYTLKGIFE